MLSCGAGMSVVAQHSTEHRQEWARTCDDCGDQLTDRSSGWQYVTYYGSRRTEGWTHLPCSSKQHHGSSTMARLLSESDEA